MQQQAFFEEIVIVYVFYLQLSTSFLWEIRDGSFRHKHILDNNVSPFLRRFEMSSGIMVK